MNTDASDIDVLVLGAGPAGCATAISLRRLNPLLRVVLVEKSDYSATRVGETLPPAIQPLLVELGVWEHFQRQPWVEAFGTHAVWGSTALLENAFIYSPYGKGWHVDRRSFDAMLTSVAGASGAVVLLNSQASHVRRVADHWRVGVRTRNENGRDVRARFIVDTTGRAASFAKRQGAQPLLYDRLVGAFVFFALRPATPPSDTYTLVEACESGWWYVASLPDARLVAAFFSDADIIQTRRLHSLTAWFSLLQEAPYTRERLAAAEPLAEPHVYVARSQHLDRIHGEGWLAVGDAISTFDPLSSQGIFKALRSGIYASRAVCADGNNSLDRLRSERSFPLLLPPDDNLL